MNKILRAFILKEARKRDSMTSTLESNKDLKNMVLNHEVPYDVSIFPLVELLPNKGKTVVQWVGGCIMEIEEVEVNDNG